MYDFESVSVSSFEAASLAATLTEKSADGWDVVAIVPAGSDVVAYLRRSSVPTPTPAAPMTGDAEQITDGTSNTLESAESTTDSAAAELLTPTSASSEPAVTTADITSPTPSTVDDRHRAAPVGEPAPTSTAAAAGGWTSGSESSESSLVGWIGATGRAHRRRRRCPPAGTPTRQVASSCATGTARRGPSTSRGQDSSTPTRPSPDDSHAARDAATASPPLMRATSLGQAGILIETAHGSIVCDPWFVPAFFGSWFVFPRNDQLGDELHEKIRNADYLYVSHLHGDHFDETWLADERNVRRDIAVLVPGYPSRELDGRLRALGFDNLIRTTDGEEHRLGGDGSELTVAIHVETSITDGPGGDSALVVSDGTSRLVNQNDCRTTDLAALAGHGPVDLHWLQYSGAIWYPMVYEMDEATMRHLVDAKIESQLTRAMRYVESIDARAVVPSAGPPCFLDPAAVPLQRRHRRRAEHLRRPAHVPRPPRGVGPRRRAGHSGHDDRGRP